MRIPSRLLVFASVPAGLIALGTLGYRLSERWSWFDSFYIAVVTLTSIGYGDTYAVSVAGRLLTLLLALGGISTLAIAATELLGPVVTGEMHEYLWRRGMTKRIAALEQHVIVCGHGYIGAQVCAQLRRAGVSVIVIDCNEAAAAAARAVGAEFVVGDAGADPVLAQAGIHRARALIALAGSDADNVLITMTARALYPGLTIVSRADGEAAVAKLLRAGATRTMSPHAIAGGRIAQAVLRPAVFDFLEDLVGEGHPDLEFPDLRMEEQVVQSNSPLAGTTVGASGFHSRRGLILIAIKHSDGQLAFDPEDDARIIAGDTLITLGRREQYGRADARALPR
ncbi:MAG TPA: NAD-binding protein [Polyangia bacterium]